MTLLDLSLTYLPYDACSVPLLVELEQVAFFEPLVVPAVLQLEPVAGPIPVAVVEKAAVELVDYSSVVSFS